MGDLGHPVNGGVERGVVAVNEDHGAAAARGDVGAERLRELRLRVIGDDIGGGEILQRIVGLARLVALDLAGLVNLGHGDVDASEVQHRRTRIVEHLAGTVRIGACRGDEDAVVAGDLGWRNRDRGRTDKVGSLPGDATCKQHQGDDKDVEFRQGQIAL